MASDHRTDTDIRLHEQLFRILLFLLLFLWRLLDVNRKQYVRMAVPVSMCHFIRRTQYVSRGHNGDRTSPSQANCNFHRDFSLPQHATPTSQSRAMPSSLTFSRIWNVNTRSTGHEPRTAHHRSFIFCNCFLAFGSACDTRPSFVRTTDQN